jgi:hypothetical protein
MRSNSFITSSVYGLIDRIFICSPVVDQVVIIIKAAPPYSRHPCIHNLRAHVVLLFHYISYFALRIVLKRGKALSKHTPSLSLIEILMNQGSDKQTCKRDARILTQDGRPEVRVEEGGISRLVLGDGMLTARIQGKQKPRQDFSCITLLSKQH